MKTKKPNDEDFGIIKESQPRPSSGSSDAAQAPTIEAMIGTQGMASRDSSSGEMRRGEGLHQKSSPIISTPAIEAMIGTQGMAPQDSSGGEIRRGEGLCQGSSPIISLSTTVKISRITVSLASHVTSSYKKSSATSSIGGRGTNNFSRSAVLSPLIFAPVHTHTHTHTQRVFTTHCDFGADRGGKTRYKTEDKTLSTSLASLPQSLIVSDEWTRHSYLSAVC